MGSLIGQGVHLYPMLCCWSGLLSKLSDWLGLQAMPCYWMGLPPGHPSWLRPQAVFRHQVRLEAELHNTAGQYIGWVLKLPRIAVHNPWLCHASSYAQQMGKAAGLTPCQRRAVGCAPGYLSSLASRLVRWDWRLYPVVGCG